MIPALLLLAALAASPYDDALEAYRAGRADEAVRILETAIAAGEGSAGVHGLLGWALLRTGDADAADEARAAFEAALHLAPDDADALAGLGLARMRLGDAAAAREAWMRALALDPDRADARAWLADLDSRALVEARIRPPVAVDAPRVATRARAARFEVPEGDGWRPLFVRGVNLGSALPGTFPAEFPDDEALYREWFAGMTELGANVVRLYTLHPPSLYRALRDHNRASPDRPLWLVQGVWTELPPEHDYLDAGFDAGFRAEIRRVIDAVHGNLRLPKRPGHAGGVYDADVSPWTLAWLLGREWEPFSVAAFERLHPDRRTFEGRFVATEEGATPIEAWLASTLETAAAHETDVYGVQRPLAFTSWPTLDPLVHPTEATVEEELAIRNLQRSTRTGPIEEYENDLCQVDATRIVAREAFGAGLYAAYHAYPYYPDFMLLDDGYAEARDAQGVARYLGYLRDLARHHGDQPVLIAELGVPTSRGIAHLHPEGQHHGGHDEVAQGEVNLRLMRNVHEAGLAGGILFAWIDEWFKHNWLVMNFESPHERNRLWLNALDAEQNYGLLAMLPGADGPPAVLDGRLDEWESVPVHQSGDGLSLKVAHDEGAVYLAVRGRRSLLAGERELWIAIDTYDAARGSTRLPPPADLDAATGFEFLVRLAARDDARILVDAPYDLFTRRNARPYRSVGNDAAEFIEIEVYTNRARYGRDGRFYPARGYSRSPLRHGTTDVGAAAFDSLADWHASADGRALELRIPWGLLNVADPSWGGGGGAPPPPRVEGVVETLRTEGFRFQLVSLSLDGGVRAAVPAIGAPLDAFPVWSWAGWEAPTWHSRRKRSFGILRDGWDSLEWRVPRVEQEPECSAQRSPWPSFCPPSRSPARSRRRRSRASRPSGCSPTRASIPTCRRRRRSSASATARVRCATTSCCAICAR